MRRRPRTEICRALPPLQEANPRGSFPLICDRRSLQRERCCDGRNRESGAQGEGPCLSLNICQHERPSPLPPALRRSTTPHRAYRPPTQPTEPASQSRPAAPAGRPLPPSRTPPPFVRPSRGPHTQSRTLGRWRRSLPPLPTLSTCTLGLRLATPPAAMKGCTLSAVSSSLPTVGRNPLTFLPPQIRRNHTRLIQPSLGRSLYTLPCPTRSTLRFRPLRHLDPVREGRESTM